MQTYETTCSDVCVCLHADTLKCTYICKYVQCVIIAGNRANLRILRWIHDVRKNNIIGLPADVPPIYTNV